MITWADAWDFVPGPNERALELPLALATAQQAPRGWILDAGCGLTSSLTADSDVTRLVQVTAGWRHSPIRGRAVTGDLRALPFRDASFPCVLCLSTLEHVGQDNRKYGMLWDHPGGMLDAARELWRVLAVGGSLMASVPYGQPEDRDWYRIVGRDELHDLIACWPGSSLVRHARRVEGGWTASDGEEQPTGAKPDAVVFIRVEKH